jgi:type I restriction enzyme S subunit
MMGNKSTAWSRLPIVSLCKAHVDCVNRTAPVVSEPTPFKMLRTTNVRNGYVDAENVRYVTEETYKRWTRRLVPKRGDIILTREAPLGDVGKIRTDDAVFLGQRLYHFRPDPNKLDADFLLYSLLGDDLHSQIMGFGSGSTVEHMRLEDIPSLEFNVPPLPVQQRIAGILSAYDELIENSQRRIKILEAMARALYREWFVLFRFSGQSLKNSTTGKAQDCGSGLLGGLCDLTKDPYKDAEHSDLPLLDLAHMPSRTLAPQDTGKPFELTTSRIAFKKGDTLFGAIRCYLHKVIAAHYSGVTNTSVLVLRPKKPCYRALLAIIASDVETIRWAETQSTGTKMPVINWGIFQKMPAPVPTEALAQEFENIAGPILDQIGVHSSQIQNLRRTRDLLLPRLLSAQIDVSNLPEPVPA